MEQRAVGDSGLFVSRLGLGTMTWGDDTDADDAAEQLRAFLDAGGTLIDTADVYGDGETERLLGTMIGGVVARESVVIATKAGLSPQQTRPRNASRGHLLRALDASLERLDTDYVDLWQVNAWDPATPIAETLSAMEIAVTSGRARYVGVSNYAGWQLATAVTAQRACGRVPLVADQVEYSLVHRDAEREMVPAALHHGVGILPWSPLGRGVLTGKYRNSTPPDSRATSSRFSAFVGKYLDDRCAGIVEAVCIAADGLGVTPLAVALAWVRDQPGVVAPIVGARTAEQLAASLPSEDLNLPEQIRTALEDISRPS